MRGYRYVKARDAIDPLPRPQNETRQRYKRLMACVALRTLHEIFTATGLFQDCSARMRASTALLTTWSAAVAWIMALIAPARVVSPAD
jgi:hypothetical protein